MRGILGSFISIFLVLLFWFAIDFLVANTKDKPDNKVACGAEDKEVLGESRLQQGSRLGSLSVWHGHATGGS